MSDPSAPRRCAIEDCERPYKQGGWCSMHYSRWYKHGDPLYVRDPMGRFWEKVIKAPSGCWRWVGHLHPSGYGRVSSGRDPDEPAVMYAHRFAYKKLVGPIPSGLVLDHLCRHKACVNPLHLQPVTNGVNIRRGSRVRVTGCKWGHAYTEENVYYTSQGSRTCRECRRLHRAEKRAA